MKQNKRFYEAPAMQVVELRHRQVLLTGSGEQLQNMRKGDSLGWDSADYDS